MRHAYFVRVLVGNISLLVQINPNEYNAISQHITENNRTNGTHNKFSVAKITPMHRIIDDSQPGQASGPRV
jgi:hypothetical protein